VTNCKPPQAGDVFVGKFSTFEELRTNLRTNINYYWPGATEQECDAQQKRMSAWRSEFPPPSNFRTNFLPSALSLYPGSELRVLDIGGGLNNSFEYLTFSLKANISVTVYDQVPSVRNGRALYGANANLEFTETLPNRPECFDVVYFGSSIQYLAEYQTVLAKVIELCPQFIVIADSALAVSETFVCAQVNMTGVKIPYRVISKSELERFIEGHGFKLIHQSINGDCDEAFRSYEYPLNKSRSWNLIFRSIAT
jgi:putative methyltransferase (TIGR04325 family)